MNSADFGGAADVAVLDTAHPITFDGVTFANNTAYSRGGAIYSETQDYFPFLPNSTFSDNIALLSGPDKAGPAVRLVWSYATPSSVDNSSGLYLPELDVTLQDSYGITVFLSDNECLVLKVVIETPDTGSKKRSLQGADTVGEIQKAIIDGEVSFTNIRVAGTPGTYTVLVQSAVLLFDPNQFVLNLTVTIEPCAVGWVLQSISESSYGVCVPAVCTAGCTYGTCVDNNNCVCSSGYTGDTCEYKDEAPYYPNYSQAGPVVIAVVAGLMIGVALFFIVTIVVYKNTPVIKSASPIFW